MLVGRALRRSLPPLSKRDARQIGCTSAGSPSPFYRFMPKRGWILRTSIFALLLWMHGRQFRKPARPAISSPRCSSRATLSEGEKIGVAILDELDRK